MKRCKFADDRLAQQNAHILHRRDPNSFPSIGLKLDAALFQTIQE
jgi:hypothetical protein